MTRGKNLRLLVSIFNVKNTLRSISNFENEPNSIFEFDIMMVSAFV